IPNGGQPNVEMLCDVLEFRRFFGREVARQAAQKATPEDLKRLEDLVNKAAEPALDAEAVMKLDFEFYIEMTRAGKNRVFQLLINTIRSAVANFSGFFASFNPPPVAVRKHQKELLKAIQSREAEKAAQIADAHLKKGAEQLIG